MSKKLITDKLTYKQRTLVDTLVSQDVSVVKAAEIAGYAKGESGRVTASKTLRLPKVQQYLMQQVGHHLALASVSGMKRLRHLLDHAKSEYVQLEASRDILDRVGFKAPDKVKHTLDGDINVKIDLS